MNDPLAANLPVEALVSPPRLHLSLASMGLHTPEQIDAAIRYIDPSTSMLFSRRSDRSGSKLGVWGQGLRQMN